MSSNFWNCLRACACMCQVCLAVQTRCWYHLPPPHWLSSDTKQYLLIMSGLICKVASGTTVAWQRWTAAMFCVYLRKMCVCVLVSVFVCLDGFPSQWQDCCYDLTWRWCQVKHHLPKQINTHLWQAQYMLSAGSVWKCSQMANWHQQKDKRLVGSQDDSPASKLSLRLSLFQDAGSVGLKA